MLDDGVENGCRLCKRAYKGVHQKKREPARYLHDCPHCGEGGEECSCPNGFHGGGLGDSDDD